MANNYKIVASMGEDDIRDVQKKDVRDIDIIEIRLDLFTRNYIQKSLIDKIDSLGTPVIFTYRRAEDSNQRSYTKLFSEDVEFLLKQFNNGNHYLDIEMNRSDSIFNNYEKLNFNIIYSYHSFKKSITLKEMKDYIAGVKKVKNKNPIFKFAITTEDLAETAEFLNNIKIISKANKIVGICMGELGMISRIYGDHYHCYFTYVSLGEPRAPGQISIENLKLFRTDLFKNKTPIEDIKS
jgi:3-dehydroquinate dehydratase-1